MKVLLSAYSCAPEFGSEPGVGWNWVRQVARFHQVWVLTRARNREFIEPALQKHPMPNVHLNYYDLPLWVRFWQKGLRGIRLHYFLWQIGAYFASRRLHGQVGFDVVHHVTFVNYWLPCGPGLLPVPFIWGPVGGGESAPKAFYQTFGLRGRIYEHFRDIARRLAGMNPFVRAIAGRACIAFATTAETADRIKHMGAQTVEILSEAGIPAEERARLDALPGREGGPFRLISAGRLIHWKGFHLGLLAFARVQKALPACEYWLIGEGPEGKNLEQLAHRLEIGDKVHFRGRLPRPQFLEELKTCDALVHPSLHDSGGWVCLEAMAAGKPVICLDKGGPGLQVTEDTGIKVPAIAPDQVITGLAEAMLRLARDPVLRQQMGEAGKRRVTEHFDWDRKGEWMNAVYHRIVSIGANSLDSLAQ